VFSCLDQPGVIGNEAFFIYLPFFTQSSDGGQKLQRIVVTGDVPIPHATIYFFLYPGAPTWSAYHDGLVAIAVEREIQPFEIDERFSEIGHRVFCAAVKCCITAQTKRGNCHALVICIRQVAVKGKPLSLEMGL
jgi:hypothetical protein